MPPKRAWDLSCILETAYKLDFHKILNKKQAAVAFQKGNNLNWKLEMEEKTTKLFEDEENTIWSVGVEGN